MDDLALRIAKLHLAPGDVLVIKSGRALDVETRKRITQYAKHVCGADTPVLVLDAGMELSVLTKADIEARAG